MYDVCVVLCLLLVLFITVGDGEIGAGNGIGASPHHLYLLKNCTLDISDLRPKKGVDSYEIF